MIVPMKKVSLVVLNKERKQALEQLKKLGVVHLEQIEGRGEQLAAFKEASNNAMVAVSVLSEVKVSKKAPAAPKLSDSEVAQKCREVIELSELKKKLNEEIAADSAELERFAPWGGVTPADFDYLKGKGISLKMYEIPEDKYNLIDENSKTVCVNRYKKVVRFLLIDAGEERPSGFPAEAFEVPMPVNSTEEIQNRISSDKKQLEEISRSFASLAAFIPQMNAFRKALESDIEFENVYSGMGQESEGKESDLAWISGFVPVDSFNVLSDAVKANGWAMASSDPSDEDEVPTKLKNNKLVSLIYPLTDFLGTVPGYHEYDISGWFLLFFTVFFGMIFGDGGYGLLVTVAMLLMMIKSAAKKEKVPPMLKLGLLLGIATVAWGTVTCTWFGLKPEQLPEWLCALSVAPLSNAYADTGWLPFWTDDASKGTLTTAQNLQIFCFTLAFLQLSVAHFKGMARYRKSLKFLGELGSMLQIWGMYYVVLSMVVSSQIFTFDQIIYGIPVGTVSIGLVAFGFALSFVFINYDGSIIASIMESVKGIISVLLGVVNVFSDIVSYIRLWAVGLAGAAISNTVNEMAGPLVGHAVLFLALVVLLVFGHGLNMVLNLLSVIVHGVRLNTLEFSNHLGMSWSGFKYAPFSETEK
ncbi:MAG: ATPase [Treponema sp.]|nr:ATPase [Treponema sp.]